MHFKNALAFLVVYINLIKHKASISMIDIDVKSKTKESWKSTILIPLHN